MSTKEEQIAIQMNMDKESFCKVAKSKPIVAAESLEPELRHFEQWMLSRGMDPLSRLEKQIVKEYLGFKLVS